MNDWQIENLQNRLSDLSKKVMKESTINFAWLMILSNIVFWVLIDNRRSNDDVKNTQVNQTKEITNNHL